MKTLIPLFAVCFALLGSADRGEAAKYVVDSVHSSVDFEIGYMSISAITGRFRAYSGVLEYDPNAVHETTLSATIEISSIDTANKDRDDHLQQDDFFHSEKFPHITFVSKEAKKGEDGNLTLVGDLSMHGVTQEVEMELEVGGVAKNHQGKEVLGFELEGEVDRIDFGVGDDRKMENGKPFLSFEVEFEINAAAIRED